MPETTPTLTDEQREELALALFVAEQCDRRQAQDVEGNWIGRLSDADRQEYRDLADGLAPLIARLERVAEQRALREAADEVAAWSTRASWVALDAVEASLRDRADRIGTTP